MSIVDGFKIFSIAFFPALVPSYVFSQIDSNSLLISSFLFFWSVFLSALVFTIVCGLYCLFLFYETMVIVHNTQGYIFRKNLWKTQFYWMCWSKKKYINNLALSLDSMLISGGISTALIGGNGSGKTTLLEIITVTLFLALKYFFWE